MLRRAVFVLLLVPFVAAAQPASAQEAAEMKWTRVEKANLDHFEGSAGEVRISNVILERESGSDPAGLGTPYEFSASVANRSKDRMRILVQIVGVKADGTPTLAAEDSVAIDSRRNDSIRTTLNAPENVLDETVAYYLHALALP
jgi:hypothetical protein